MAKQQKAKNKDVVKKVKKASSKGPKESQFIVQLQKKVNAALKQYDYKKDKGGQFLHDGEFVSGDYVKHATTSKHFK